MKKSYTVNILTGLFLLAGLITGCQNKPAKDVHVTHAQVQQYTCPMHPEIIRDKPGKCPICGMDLVAKQSGTDSTGIDTSLAPLLKPVNQQVISTIPTITAESGPRIFSEEVQGVITFDTRNQANISSRVSGRIERLLIKYNYQPVKQGQLIMEIYSPDLVAAQRELIFIYQNDRNDPMLQKAKQRLSLLGMQPSQINQVIRTGKPIYRVPVYSNATGYILEKSQANAPTTSMAPTPTASSAGSDMDGMGGGGSTGGSSTTNATSVSPTTPILTREGQYVNAGQSIFTIYKTSGVIAEFAFSPSFAAEISKGQKLVFRSIGNPEKVYTGSIGLIQPVLRNGENFTSARVYLPGSSEFTVGELILANIPIKKRGWWLPQEAVWRLGNRSIVFKKENEVFVPKQVETGLSVSGTIQILTDISDWQVAKSAYYLVDSESFITTSPDNNKR
jgi:membrane fusion protein, copper/silver efflux system